jgi:xanthine dehydrogenase YagS FAD-binding subunit
MTRGADDRMKPFTYSRSTSVQAAIAAAERTSHVKFLGGGTNLIDLMREQIEQPDALVDITGLPFSQMTDRDDGGLSIGAGARNTAVASHPSVRARYPMLSEAILCGASAQIRNMATVGGNLMQRTRCLYFYDRTSRCNRRQTVSGCDAIDGFTRMHAILGTSDACIATHPSDMCVALAALDATVRVASGAGERSIPFTDFHRLPGDTPHLETELRPGELITSVELPPLEWARTSVYRKVRDRSSYAFSLVSVAAAVSARDGRIDDVRLALGGVGTKPWRAFEAERHLQGAPASVERLRFAIDAELAGARTFAHNHFKIELARRTVVSVLGDLLGRGGGR